MKYKKTVWLLTMVFVLIGTAFSVLWNRGQARLIDGDSQLTNEMHEVISDYIVNHYSTVYYPTEKQFEVHKVYGTSETNGVLTVYLWSYYNGFNKTTATESQAGHSLPAVIKLKKVGDEYKVVKYSEPQDGSSYSPSLKKLFPKRYLAFVYMDSGNIGGLQAEMDEKVKQWLNE
ncbi:MAG: hypothetical protein ACQEUT_15755 [Bacillota bacterium]